MLEAIEKDIKLSKKFFIERRMVEFEQEISDFQNSNFPIFKRHILHFFNLLKLCEEVSFDKFCCSNELREFLQTDSKTKKEIIRYFTFPAISESDIVSLLEWANFSNKTVITKGDELLRFIYNSLDKIKFPKKTEYFSEIALFSILFSFSEQKFATTRRSKEKNMEDTVESLLIEQKYCVKKKSELETCENLTNGQYVREFNAYGENSDFIFRHHNGELCFLECKASNSEINSRKRLNKEFIKSSDVWKTNIQENINIGCFIRGVFKPEYLMEILGKNISIFWDHNPNRFGEFIGN